MPNIFRKFANYLTATQEVKLTAYRSYGTKNHLYQLGRALDDDKIKMEENQSLGRTVINIFKQFDTDEVADAEVALQLPNGAVLTVTTNKEGYFLFDKTTSINLEQYANDEGWVPLSVSFVGDVRNSIISSSNRFEVEFLIPPPTASFGVLSNIDDTILQTGVTSFLKWRVLHNSLLKNAHDRIFLEDAPDFYSKLHEGRSGNEQNPCFI